MRHQSTSNNQQSEPCKVPSPDRLRPFAGNAKKTNFSMFCGVLKTKSSLLGDCFFPFAKRSPFTQNNKSVRQLDSVNEFNVKSRIKFIMILSDYERLALLDGVAVAVDGHFDPTFLSSLLDDARTLVATEPTRLHAAKFGNDKHVSTALRGDRTCWVTVDLCTELRLNAMKTLVQKLIKGTKNLVADLELIPDYSLQFAIYVSDAIQNVCWTTHSCPRCVCHSACIPYPLAILTTLTHPIVCSPAMGQVTSSTSILI